MPATQAAIQRAQLFTGAVEVGKLAYDEIKRRQEEARQRQVADRRFFEEELPAFQASVTMPAGQPRRFDQAPDRTAQPVTQPAFQEADLLQGEVTTYRWWLEQKYQAAYYPRNYVRSLLRTGKRAPGIAIILKEKSLYELQQLEAAAPRT